MENKDYLKDFIDSNRPNFEQEADMSHLWASIEEKLPKTKKKSTRIISIKWMSIAASVLLLVGAGFFVGRMGASAQTDLAAAQPKFIEMDQHYAQQVSMLIVEAKDNSEVDQSVFNDIMNMEEQYKELIAEYNEVESDSRKEFLLSAMINNYRTRIDMLNHVLLIIKTSKNGNNLPVQEIKI